MATLKPQIPVPAEQLADFCRRWKIAELSLFGSVLRADFRPDSDVDVLVTFQEEAGWSYFDLFDMEDELSELLARKVDLVPRGGLKNPFRRAEILRSSQVVYAA